MNNSYEAKRGFITFITTLVIASGIFFTAYYAVNKLNSQAALETQKAQTFTTTENQPAASTSPSTETKAEKPSIFAELAKSPDTITLNTKAKPGVLGVFDTPGASGQSTGSIAPKPNTGSESIASIFLLSAVLISVGFYFGADKSRKLAIKAFEKDITKGL